MGESDDQGIKKLEAMFAEQTDKQSEESDDQGVKKLDAMFAEQTRESAESRNAQATESKRSDTQGPKTSRPLSYSEGGPPPCNHLPRLSCRNCSVPGDRAPGGFGCGRRLSSNRLI